MKPERLRDKYDELPIEMWRCSSCEEVFTSFSSAEHCCNPVEISPGPALVFHGDSDELLVEVERLRAENKRLDSQCRSATFQMSSMAKALKKHSSQARRQEPMTTEQIAEAMLWKAHRERELLLALFEAAARPTYSSGGSGPRMYDGTFCVICQADLTSPDRPWKRWFGHKDDCIVKPAEALAKEEGDTHQ